MAEGYIPFQGVVEVPLTFESGINVGNSFKCYRCGKVVFISANNITFNSIGDNQLLVRGVPAPINQVSFNRPAGANLTESQGVMYNSAYILGGADFIRFNIEQNNTYRHWFNCIYLTT